MQDDLDADYPDLAIQILGVNELGYEAGIDAFTEGRDIPWLQDVDEDEDGESDVWTSWDVTFRDVVIVDAENVKVATFNLDTYDLQIPENYDTLLQAFVDAALDPGDMDADGDVDIDDLPLFVDVLVGLDPDHVARADMNGDGLANGLDIQPFANVLLY